MSCRIPINVLNRTMSLVGPRPQAVDYSQFFSELVVNYFVRRRVKPGITVWAQGSRRLADLSGGVCDRPQRLLIFLSRLVLVGGSSKSQPTADGAMQPIPPQALPPRRSQWRHSHAGDVLETIAAETPTSRRSKPG